MGREIKRVPVDFDWPIAKIWKGFINPHPGPKNCSECGGEGLNAATREISELFYDHDGFGSRWTYAYGVDPNGNAAERPPWAILGDCRRWCDSITQDEVDALVAHGRLMNFTHAWTAGTGWKRRDDLYVPTASEVNAWNGRGGLGGHDSINRWILVKARARRLGVYGNCRACHGRGHEKMPRKMKKKYLGWKEFGPPRGDGWQVWETVSEGSPISPVFATANELVGWLVSNGYSVAAAKNFVKSTGWVPSLVSVGGKHYSDIEAAAIGEEAPGKRGIFLEMA